MENGSINEKPEANTNSTNKSQFVSTEADRTALIQRNIKRTRVVPVDESLPRTRMTKPLVNTMYNGSRAKIETKAEAITKVRFETVSKKARTEEGGSNTDEGLTMSSTTVIQTEASKNKNVEEGSQPNRSAS